MPRSATARRTRPKEDRSRDWLTTYADAITLLMAFFVLLYAMSEIDVIKFTAFLQGLSQPFGNEAGEALLPEQSGLLPDNPPPTPDGQPEEMPELPSALLEEVRALIDPDRDEAGVEGNELEQAQEELERLTTELEELERRLEESEPTLEEELAVEAARRLRSEAQMDLVQEALGSALGELGLEVFTEERRTERGLVVSIASDDILFELGSTRIDTIGREIIAVVSETLAAFPNQILVEGHTDDVPLDRNGYTNWNLSTDRAVSVLSLMIEEYGIEPPRIGAAGYSEYRPQASNATPAGRAQNRRVDIVILLEEVPA